MVAAAAALAGSTRTLTVVAQDPTLRSRGRIVTARLAVPRETLAPGPRGHRAHVIDYDVSTKTLYAPRRTGYDGDIYEEVSSDQILSDPQFHAQNAYAVVMATLARFETALGRHVQWAFAGLGHQIKIVPHAFAEPNAFYSRRDESLLFGYFPSRHKPSETIFTCLSFDVVAHETTHAVVDGLRERYMEPSSPDQAAFHEGFADVVAILSSFRLREVLDHIFPRPRSGRVPRALFEPKALQRTALLGLADELGDELGAIRGHALRESATLDPRNLDLGADEFLEPHRRGEVFAAAMINAFIGVWCRRIEPLIDSSSTGTLDRDRAIEEGTTAAGHLLTMAIRALDYCPPVDLQFGDFLSAVLTADQEIQPDDSKFGYREALRSVFADYGIEPTSKRNHGCWDPPPNPTTMQHTHFEAMQRDPDEVFRFVWENRDALQLHPDAYTKVQSVRPCLRLAPDGFFLRETVAEYVQIFNVRAHELAGLGIRKPDAMPGNQSIWLFGGGALLFDEYGRLKYHIGSGIVSKKGTKDQGNKQSERLAHLWESGFYAEDLTPARRFSALHRSRAVARTPLAGEGWI